LILCAYAFWSSRNHWESFRHVGEAFFGIDQRLEAKAFLEEWNDAVMAELARCVANRKAVLYFLEMSIGRQDDGKYRLVPAVADEMKYAHSGNFSD
jgi:hypothetical protein